MDTKDDGIISDKIHLPTTFFSPYWMKIYGKLIVIAFVRIEQMRL